MDPISTVVSISGETAVLHSPTTTAAYDPSSSVDYAPNLPGNLTVQGVPERKIEHVVGATGAFTFQATSKPTGLKANQSTLNWRGQTWRVVEFRERTWRGVINGYTLYLAQ